MSSSKSLAVIEAVANSSASNLTQQEIIDHLSNHYLFKGLTLSEISVIADFAIYNLYPAGQIIHNSEVIPQKVILSISGSLQLVAEKNCEIESEFLGIAAILLSNPLSKVCQVSADKPLCCLQFSRDNFLSIINECPEIITNFIEHFLIEQLSDVQEVYN